MYFLRVDERLERNGSKSFLLNLHRGSKLQRSWVCQSGQTRDVLPDDPQPPVTCHQTVLTCWIWAEFHLASSLNLTRPRPQAQCATASMSTPTARALRMRALGTTSRACSIHARPNQALKSNRIRLTNALGARIHCTLARAPLQPRPAPTARSRNYRQFSQILLSHHAGRP